MTARWGRAALAATVALGAYAVAPRIAPALNRALTRTNYAGREVTLWEGPAAVLALLAAAATTSPTVTAATVVAGGLGALDDHAQDTASKGLRGHLRAAREGTITTGLVKLVGLGTLGVAVAAGHSRRQPQAERALVRGLRVGAGAAVVAGSANLANLFDVRPGRALKVSVLAAAPLLGRPDRAGQLAAAVVGTAAALLRADLAGESMLGDTGANALGAVLGIAACERLGLRGQAALAAAVAAATLASERISFTAVIDATPGLRHLDAWGRDR